MVNLGWRAAAAIASRRSRSLSNHWIQAARSRMTTACTGDGLASFRAIGRALDLVMLLADLAAGGEVLLPLR
jgi:hypothetical protein